MTSPSQLKYLDAIGIPVWVSRDIVVDAVAVVKVSEAVTGTPIEVSNETSNRTLNEAQTQNFSSTSSVESILQDLNQQNTPARTRGAEKTREVVKTAADQSTPPVYDSQEKSANEVARTSSHIVYGSGNLQADWLVIGESPEINDDRQNQPYAGEPGVLLCNMLRAVGLENPRESAYLVNVIKSSMQAIEPSSIGELNQILNAKILEIKPKMILVVGQLSAQNLLQSKEPLARLRAKALKHSDTDTHIVVTYYPSYLLSKPTDKRKAWEDLKLAMRLMSE